jgi:hypothetical protein
MKKLVFALLLVAAAFVFAQGTNPVAAVAMAAPAAVVASEPWQKVLSEIALLALQVVGPVLGLLASWAVWKLAAKFHMEKNATLDGLLQEKVRLAVGSVEGWAKTQAGKPSSQEKLNKAVDIAKGFLQISGLPKLAEDKLKAMIEAKLSDEKDLIRSKAKA